MKFLKTILSATFSFLLFNFIVVNLALASTFEQVMKGFKQTGTAAGYPVTSGGAPKKSFIEFWSVYINGMLTLMGVLFMVNIIYAGFLWMSARGKDEQVERAKKLIINAVIGLAIIIGARLIVELSLYYLGRTIPTT